MVDKLIDSINYPWNSDFIQGKKGSLDEQRIKKNLPIIFQYRISDITVKNNQWTYLPLSAGTSGKFLFLRRNKDKIDNEINHTIYESFLFLRFLKQPD